MDGFQLPRSILPDAWVEGDDATLASEGASLPQPEASPRASGPLEAEPVDAADPAEDASDACDDAEVALLTAQAERVHEAPNDAESSQTALAEAPIDGGAEQGDDDVGDADALSHGSAGDAQPSSLEGAEDGDEATPALGDADVIVVKRAAPGTQSAERLASRMSVKDMRDALREHDLPTHGVKAVLAARMLEHGLHGPDAGAPVALVE